MIVKLNEELTQLDQQAVKEELALLNAALNNWPIDRSFQQNIPSERGGQWSFIRWFTARPFGVKRETINR